MAMSSYRGQNASAKAFRESRMASAVEGAATVAGEMSLNVSGQTSPSQTPPQGEEIRPYERMPYEYEAPSNRRDVRIAVIGGGLAGLMAGWHLALQGYDVTVIEAQNRVGGRVDTQRPALGPIEAGAELIGKIHNRWVKLANHFNLGLSPIATETMYGWQKLDLPVWLNGRCLTRPEKTALFSEVEAVYKQLNVDANYVDPYEPWASQNAFAWDAKSVEDWIADSLNAGDIGQDTATMLRYELGANQASPVHLQSYLGLLAAVRGGSRLPLEPDEEAPYWEGSETYRCSAGNQTLPERMMEACQKAGGSVLLNEAVTRVNWDGHNYELMTNRRAPTPISADWVVLAIPPSVYHRVTFDPIMLSSEITRLGQIQLGDAVKYLAHVRERFWLSQGLAPTADHTTLGIVWEATDSQNLQAIAHKTLTVFAGGPLANTRPWGAKPDVFFQKELNNVFNGFAHQVDPSISTFVNWPVYPWSLCGYSCPGLNQVTTICCDLVNPLQQLVFAGEHTSTAFFGFMEGALESGVRAAQLIFTHTGHVPVPRP
jgi:monoamine oxidase